MASRKGKGEASISQLVSPTTNRGPCPAAVLFPSVQSCPPNSKLLSSAAGLVLIGRKADSADLSSDGVLSVVNPVTGLKRDVCSKLKKGYRVRQLVVDDEKEGRFMIVAEKSKTAVSDLNLEVLLYDSETKVWSRDGTLRSIIRWPLDFTAAACVHGTPYCLAITQETAHLFHFDKVHGWRDSLPRVPSSLYPQKHQNWMQNPGYTTVCKPHLFRYRGDLMIVGVTLYKYGCKSRWDHMEYSTWDRPNIQRDSDNVAEEGVHLWKLDEQKMMWTHEMRMPEHMFDTKAETYEFLSNEEYLFAKKVMPKQSKERSRMFSCELSCGYSWNELPSTLLQAWD